MRNLNKCTFIGRLGADPEVRYLPDGTQTVSLTIACGDDYKSNEGVKIERTEWVRLSAFGKLAEIIGQYTRKGSKIYADGKYTTRKWNKDGVDHYATEIRLQTLELLDAKKIEGLEQNTPPPKPQTQHHTQKSNVYEPAENFAAQYDDDILF